MSSCVCKISFKSVQVCGGYCKMFRGGLTFWDTVYEYSKHVGSPYSRTKIYAARVSRVSTSFRSISAARARPQQQTRRTPLLLLIDGTHTHARTDGQTDTWPLYDANSIVRGPRNRERNCADSTGSAPVPCAGRFQC